MSKDKATSFVEDTIFDKLGIIHKEFFTKDGKLHTYFVTNKQFLELEDLIQLQKHLESEQLRVYPQSYSKFANMQHTAVIFCINNTK